MTSTLKTLGLTFVAALALAALMAPVASSSSALFTANVGAFERPRFDGGQTGKWTDTFTVNGLKIECVTATLTGEALSVSPSSTEITLNPIYNECHVIIAGLTKLVTVTMNGCGYRLNATRNTGGFFYTADLTVECPAFKSIEIHIYNAALSETSTICTYDIGHQTYSGAFQLTNNAAATPDDIIAHSDFSFGAENTIKSAICGQLSFPFIFYDGEDTLQTTDAGGVLVNGSVS